MEMFCNFIQFPLFILNLVLFVFLSISFCKNVFFFYQINFCQDELVRIVSVFPSPHFVVVVATLLSIALYRSHSFSSYLSLAVIPIKYHLCLCMRFFHFCHIIALESQSAHEKQKQKKKQEKKREQTFANIVQNISRSACAHLFTIKPNSNGNKKTILFFFPLFFFFLNKIK